MKRFLIFFLCLGISTSLVAQENWQVSGRVVDESGMGLTWAVISLYSTLDTQLVDQKPSEEDGSFQLLSTSKEVWLQVVYFGQEKYWTTLEVIQDLDLGEIILTSDFMLQGVEVTARKAEIKYENGKLTYQNPNKSASLNSLSLLKGIPLIIVNENEELLLKGSLARVLVNGKDLRLSGEALKTYLNGLPTDQIERVEVITNPSARYESEGATGIINIITKAPVKGLAASLFSEGSQGQYFTYRGGGNLSYFTQKFGLAFNIRATEYRSFNDLTVNRQPLDSESPEDLFSENSFYFTAGTFIRSGLSLNYEINDRNSISGFFNAYFDDPEDQQTGLSTFDEAGQTRRTELEGFNDQINQNYSLGLFYEHQIDTTGQKLVFNYLQIDYDKEQLVNQQTSFFNTGSLTDIFELNNPNQQNYKLRTLKTDYLRQINKKWNFEGGLKVSRVINDNALRFRFAEEDRPFLFLPVEDNDFIYREWIYSTYTSSQLSLGAWNVRLGLRAEYTDFNTTSRTNGEEVDNQGDYFNLFPNLAATYHSSSSSSISLSYGRRLRRPTYNDLNPSTLYSTQYLYIQGNPLLLPEYSNNFELGLKFNRYVVSLYANLATQTTGEYLIQDKIFQTTLLTKVNLDRNHQYGALFSSTFDLLPKLSLQVSSLSQWQQTRFNTPQGELLEQSIFKVETTAGLDFKLNKHLGMHWSTYYTTPFLNGLYRVRSQIFHSANIVYHRNGLKIGLGMQDIFRTGIWDSTIQTETHQIRWVNRWQNGIVSLSVSYQLGNKEAKGKGRYQGKRSTEESQRIQ